MDRFIVLPVNTQWGIWDTLIDGWASYFALTPEDLTYLTIAEASNMAYTMNTEAGLN